MSAPVVHFEIITGDANRLREFYRTVFGWKINVDNPMNYGMVDTGAGGRGIGGGIGAPGPEGGGHLTFYIEVPSIDAALAKIVEIGGAVVQPRTVVPPNGPVLAQFRDPVGYRIGLIEGMMSTKPAAKPKPAAKVKPAPKAKAPTAAAKAKKPSKASKPAKKQAAKKAPAKKAKAKGRR